MFFNGLPLGMIGGLVVRYLEGRRASELLLAALSCSFIVASGAVKRRLTARGRLLLATGTARRERRRHGSCRSMLMRWAQPSRS